jgi:ABC-type bacteriocin/lantibiotic exporter with double-glycine peptidase domain
VVTWWLGALVLTAFLSLPSHGSEKAPDSDGHLDVPSSPCGPNCLYAVFGLLGVEAEYVTLFQQTVDQPDGSSMQVLVNTARKYGLQATPLTNLSIMDLKSCPYPAILHVKKTTSSVKYDHYEVYIPSDSKALVLYDPPNASREVDRRELDDRWSGSAILLSHIPISMRFLWLPHLLRFAVSVLVVGAIALVLFFGQRNIESSRASTLKKRIMVFQSLADGKTSLD